MFSPITDQRPVFIDSFGNPASYGRVTYYNLGTTTPKTIYSDYTLATPIQNPQILNVAGRTDTQVFAGYGNYTVLVERFIGVDILTADPITDWVFDNQFDVNGLETIAASGTMATVSTIALLKAINPATYASVLVTGYNTLGDCPARVFNWIVGYATSENLGTVVDSNVSSAGRWVLNVVGDSVDVRIFGAIPDTNGAVNGSISNCEGFCNSLSGHPVTMYFPKGIYQVSGTLTQVVRVNCKIDKGVYFNNITAAANYKLDLQSSYDIHLDDCLNLSGAVGSSHLLFSKQGTVNAEWFGAGSSGLLEILNYVSDGNTLVVNDARGGNVTTGYPTVKHHLVFGYNGSLTLTGAGYTVRPLSVTNGNPNGCFLGLTTGLLNLRDIPTHRLSWFNSAIDAGRVIAAEFNQTISGHPLIIDCNRTLSNAFVGRLDIMPETGILTMDNAGIDLSISKILGGDIALFDGTVAFVSKGITRLAWWVYGGMSHTTALQNACNVASLSDVKTLEGSNIHLSSVAGTINVGANYVNNLRIQSGSASLNLTSYCTFTGCYVNTTGNAIVNNGGYSCVISNNDIESTSYAYFGGDCVELRITNNRFRGDMDISSSVIMDSNFLGSGGTYNGIAIKNTAIIAGNVIENSIIMSSTSSIHGITITDNVFTDVGNHPIVTMTTSTALTAIKGVTIVDNVFKDYSVLTDVFTSSITGSGSWTGDPMITIHNNAKTNSNVTVRQTQGTAAAVFKTGVVNNYTGRIDMSAASNIFPPFLIGNTLGVFAITSLTGGYNQILGALSNVYATTGYPYADIQLTGSTAVINTNYNVQISYILYSQAI